MRYGVDTQAVTSIFHRRTHRPPHGAEHIWDGHRVSVEQASEALDDERLVAYPDRASRSGVSARAIGYSHTAAAVLVAILVRREDRHDAWWGAMGWRASSTERSTYSEQIEEKDPDDE